MLVRRLPTLGALVIACFSASTPVRAADICQSSTFCVHDQMPLWSQGDSPGFNVNGGTPTLLAYVQQRHGGKPQSEQGWCGGVSSAMILKSYANEMATESCQVTGTYSWLNGTNPSEIIYKTFGVVNTDILEGGTSTIDLENIKTVLSGSLARYSGFSSVINFRTLYQRPHVTIGVCASAGCHAISVYGTDGQYHIVSDPWGSTYHVTADKYDTTSGVNLRYIGSKIGGGSMIQSFGPSVSMVSALTVSDYRPSLPVLKTQPTPQIVRQGTATSFQVQFAGAPSPTFQWLLNGQNISGATSSSYSLSAAQLSHAGNYQVKLTNCQGTVTSSNANLQVQTVPTFTLQPVSQTVTEGNSITFTSQASGVPSPTYQWQLNSVNIPGATSASLPLSNVKRTQQGTYRVIATNAAGSTTSKAVTLTVNYAPAFVTHPSNKTTVPEGFVTFTSEASGIPTPTYQWQFNGVNISGATEASLTINPVNTTKEGTYKVIATNSIGSVTSNSAALAINSLPVISSQPTSKTVIESGTITLTSQATGNPVLTYQWQFNGVNISGANSSTLKLVNVNRNQQGTYRVLVSNGFGSVTSSDAILTVNYLPNFSTRPVNQKVLEGDPATFTAQATGNPTPTYQWKFNGVNLPAGTGSVFTIPSAALSHAGNYQVVISNSVGSVLSSVVSLTVEKLVVPIIVTQPEPFTIPVGESPFTLSTEVTSEPPAQFQWFHNGVAIEGANTSSLNLPLTGKSPVGTYTVKVSNKAGSTMSAPAQVGANPGVSPINSGVAVPSYDSSAGIYHYYPDHGVIPQLTGGK